MKPKAVALLIAAIIVIVALIILTKRTARPAGKFIDMATLGADPTGKSDSSRAVLEAWKVACHSTLGRSTIVFPEGRYSVRSSMVFHGKQCRGDVEFKLGGATIVGPEDYMVLGDGKDWLLFEEVSGVSFSGGVLDGRGGSLWDCKRDGNGCPRGATTLRFTDSANIEIKGLKSLNSQLYHIVFHGCKNVKLEGVSISAPRDSPNTDGIHVQLSTDVTISKTNVGTGDDCVSVGPGTTRLRIENMACGPGHGISIGSLGKEMNEEGVQDVTVKTTTFTESKNGVRIKSWARPSKGFVRNVLFQHITMVNVENPIIIDQNYCPHHEDCPDKVSGIKISDVTYQDIHGTSATSVAVKFDCSPMYPCTNINLDDINLSYNNQGIESSCNNVEGSTSNVC